MTPAWRSRPWGLSQACDPPPGPTQEQRTRELLRRLEGTPRPWNARFVSLIALAAPGHPTEFFEGECRGEIVPEWRGQAGFGYDPVFLPGRARRFGEMTRRRAALQPPGRAARALLESGFLERVA